MLKRAALLTSGIPLERDHISYLKRGFVTDICNPFRFSYLTSWLVGSCPRGIAKNMLKPFIGLLTICISFNVALPFNPDSTKFFYEVDITKRDFENEFVSHVCGHAICKIPKELRFLH